MTRFLAGAAAILAAALMAAPTALADDRRGDDDRRDGLTYAVIGDTPYGTAQLENFPSDVTEINADPAVSRVLHLGDIKNGSSVCSDEYFSRIRTAFDGFSDPLVFTPGDNEWTDCHRPNNGAYDPLERLGALRDTFFDRPGRTLGRRSARVEAQSPPDVENVRWQDGRVVFATAHVVGSNNGWLPWTGQATQTPAQVDDVESRTAAAVEWIDETFDDARRRQARGVVIGIQADLWDPTFTGPADYDRYGPFVRALADEARAFGRPVLLLNGDSHVFTDDRPLLDPQKRALYGVTDEVPNLRRITVNGSTTPCHEWVRLTVDARRAEVFGITRVRFAGQPGFDAALCPPGTAPGSLRVATFNASLNRANAGDLVAHLSTPAVDDVFRRQARNVAEVVQRTRPEIVLINEFDYAPGAAELFRDNFLAVGQNGAEGIDYPYVYAAPSNTGVASGLDLNGDGVVGSTPGTAAYANDALGFGFFPGQFGMVVFSQHPIDTSRARTFQDFRWSDMPGNLIPTPFYSPDEVSALRLSSKSHWDLPISVGGTTVHLLASHPTPPVFDGPEDRNGRRNFDEIRFWADYVTPRRGSYIYDDRGVRGGLRGGERFVIVGDQNSDPLDGDSVPGAIQQILDSPMVNAASAPTSAGAPEAAALQGGANATHRGDPATDTADFADGAPGNLRADYVLPRAGMAITGAGVYWPVLANPLSRLTGVFDAAAWGPVGGFPTSDHRLVWADVRVAGRR